MVIDSRRALRRRECLQCKKRFTTEEIVVTKARPKQVVRTRPEGAPPPKPKIDSSPEIKHKEKLQQVKTARNRIEDLREEKLIRGLDDEYPADICGF